MNQRTDPSRPHGTPTPSDAGDRTVQQRKDEAEKRKHPASENALESTQEKNPVPEGGTRRNG
jgi:hypothetical protein